MASVSMKKDGRWFVQYINPEWPEKKPRLKSEYFGRGPAAEKLAWIRKSEFEHQTKTANESNELTFDDLCQQYLNSRTAMPQKGIKNLFYRFQNVIGPHLGHLQVSKITHDRLIQYQKERAVEKRTMTNSVTGHKRTLEPPSKITIHDELTDIMTVLNWAAYIKKPALIGDNPAKGFKKGPRPSNNVNPPSQEELHKILAHSADHLKRVILLNINCGYRPGPIELFSATWDLVDFGKNIVTVISADKGGLVKRDVPIRDDFKKQLLAWYNQDKKAGIKHIIHFKGKPIKDIKNAWKMAKKRAGIKRRLRLYDLRHFFVTTMLENGADLKSVSLLAGHKSVDITMRIYQHVSDQLKRDAINTLPSFKLPEHTEHTNHPQPTTKKVVNINT